MSSHRTASIPPPVRIEAPVFSPTPIKQVHHREAWPCGSGTRAAEALRPSERPDLSCIPESRLGGLSSTAGEMETSAWGGGGDALSNESFLLLRSESLRAPPCVGALTGSRRDQDPGSASAGREGLTCGWVAPGTRWVKTEDSPAPWGLGSPRAKICQSRVPPRPSVLAAVNPNWFALGQSSGPASAP